MPLPGHGLIHTETRWLAPPADFTGPSRGRNISYQSLKALRLTEDAPATVWRESSSLVLRRVEDAPATGWMRSVTKISETFSCRDRIDWLGGHGNEICATGPKLVCPFSLPEEAAVSATAGAALRLSGQ